MVRYLDMFFQSRVFTYHGVVRMVMAIPSYVCYRLTLCFDVFLIPRGHVPEIFTRLVASRTRLPPHVIT